MNNLHEHNETTCLSARGWSQAIVLPRIVSSIFSLSAVLPAGSCAIHQLNHRQDADASGLESSFENGAQLLPDLGKKGGRKTVPVLDTTFIWRPPKWDRFSAPFFGRPAEPGSCFGDGHGRPKRDPKRGPFGDRAFTKDDPARALALISPTVGMSWWANRPFGMPQCRLQRLTHL